VRILVEMPSGESEEIFEATPPENEIANHKKCPAVAKNVEYKTQGKVSDARKAWWFSRWVLA